MNDIEAIIALILLFMGVPDLCQKLGRPALAYPVFVVFGILLGVGADPSLRTMLVQAGTVGFLLLLFEVGLEIELPAPREMVRPLGYALGWSAVQYPLVLLVGQALRLPLAECVIASSALTACSVGMAHAAWKAYPGLSEERRGFLLQVMVLLEVMAIFLLAIEAVVMAEGVGVGLVVKLAGIGVVVALISRFSSWITRLFQVVLERTTHWRIHFVVLVILIICAIGQRLGLSAAKTAFFLGLFMSRMTHEEVALEEYIAPISKRFLIPIFFVGLGLQVPPSLLLTAVAPGALGLALLLLGAREILHRRWLPTGGDRRAYLLLCPNLTIAALAAKTMLEHGGKIQTAGGLLLVGLFMSVISILLLPAATSRGSESAPAPQSGSNSG